MPSLHFRTLGPAPGTAPALVVLHGLFGSSDNWNTLARRWALPLAEGGTGRTVYLVDQRNHGRSFHDPAITYALLTQDLVAFFDQHQLGPDTIVLGHSMGGKVAMRFALHHPTRLAKVIVIDIAPRAYAPHHRELLDGLLKIDIASVENRDAADRLLQAVAPEADTRLFLLKNLYRDEQNRFAWRLNVAALDRHLPDLGAEITGAPAHPQYLGQALFIRGGKSRYVSPEDKLTGIPALFPNSEVVTVPDAGHWVHAEAPEAVAALVRSFVTGIGE
ncbi:MAG: alpha/beta fold hydrolase [Hymenobacteraceae bacterium]|nr:alpha/beta fold hydrolase [Hymenobacteraceae bacterium]